MDKTSKIFLGLALVFIALIPVSIYIISPNLTKIDANFNYRADIISIDNFYDAEKGDFSGEVQSRTTFRYNAINRIENILLIKGIFDVRSVDNQPIFKVEREYAVDAITYAHVPGYGDLDREGYFFLPKNIKKGEQFKYWFIATDNPVTMEFVNEEIIDGVVVYHYRANLMKFDLTSGYTHLPGVPEERRVKNDILLEAWFEPQTGILVKFAEQADSDFYDAATEEKLYPRNKYSNTYTGDSVVKQIALVKNNLKKIALYKKILPVMFLLIATIFAVLSFTGSFRSVRAGLISVFVINGLVVWFINFNFFLENIYLILALSIFISLLLGIIFSRVFVGPLVELKDVFSQISQGNLNPHIKPSNLKEIRELLDSTQMVITSLKLSVFRKGSSKTGIAGADKDKPATKAVGPKPGLKVFKKTPANTPEKQAKKNISTPSKKN